MRGGRGDAVNAAVVWATRMGESVMKAAVAEEKYGRVGGCGGGGG